MDEISQAYAQRRERLERLRWMKGLRAGDIVMDCTGKVRRISGIVNERSIKLPTWIPETIVRFLVYVIYNVRIGPMVDRHLTFEDGNDCHSALACCHTAYGPVQERTSVKDLRSDHTPTVATPTSPG